ncbi:glutamine-hydrolyzing carbamoyl-phosphate synthase small subunit [Paraperlucidibaca sp.]|uniref:glutamine-hydrolyzing carbamoyl-phosphate synthase small subunit n=1 Tax=Paraperlucidibaca sp. TaxID=2708021 RepID=UPI00398A2D7E
MSKVAILALEDGSVFKGVSIGADGQSSGEVVFNTAMTGYQEILTDPSYCQQMVTLTYPHIGNTGVNNEDNESTQVWAAGLIIRDSSMIASNWRMTEALPDYLVRNNVVAIAEIDTRRLTRILRESGTQNGVIVAGAAAEVEGAVEAAIASAKKVPSLKGADLAKVVSTKEVYRWTEGSWDLAKGYVTPTEAPRFKVVAYDFGVKHNILRLLVDRGCELIVVPAQTSAADVLAMNPDGVFLSNGPGDPEPCDYAIAAIKTFLDKDLPIFGICLGHQLLALASGAKTLKMKFGHHGANHPVQNLDTGRVMITSQNHGFSVDGATLPATLRATHKSLFDDSLQGLHHTDKPAFSFQGHPEASPGPTDVQPLFDHFFELMQARK